jgi:tetratricopeptide (TPR) repeat protein
MRGLLPYYRSIRDHGREAEAMEVIVMAEPDSAARTSQLLSLANLYAQMEGRQLDALRVRRELLVASPRTLPCAPRSSAPPASSGAWTLSPARTSRCSKTLQQRADEPRREGRPCRARRSAPLRELQLARGTILRDDLRQGEEAEKASPRCSTARRRTRRLRGARGAAQDARRQRGADEALPPPRRRHLRPRGAEAPAQPHHYIARDVLGQREVAIRTAEELLDLVPDDLKTMEQLAAMYELSDQPDDHYALEELLGRWADLVEGDELRHSIATRRAALRMDKLNDAFGAVDLLGQVLGEDPSNADARALLERCSTTRTCSCRPRRCWSRSTSAFATTPAGSDPRGPPRHAEELGSSDEAIGYLLEIARIQEYDLDNPRPRSTRSARPTCSSRAAATSAASCSASASSSRSSASSSRCGSSRSRSCPTPSGAKIELLSRIAVVLDDHLQDQDGARKAYAELLALDPPDLELARRATVALARLHRSAGDSAALIDTLRALLRFIDKDAEQVKILLEIAELQRDKLADLEAAAASLPGGPRHRPRQLAAMDALERIYVGQGAWEPLTRVLRQRVMAVDDSGERARLWRKIGEIQREQLKDPYQAIEAFQGVVDAGAPARTPPTRSTRSSASTRKLERWPEVEEGLRRLLDARRQRRDPRELLGRAADVVGDKLGRYPDAIDLLEQVLKISPEDEAPAPRSPSTSPTTTSASA